MPFPFTLDNGIVREIDVLEEEEGKCFDYNG
jgi:hypothetical protein